MHENPEDFEESSSHANEGEDTDNSEDGAKTTKAEVNQFIEDDSDIFIDLLDRNQKSEEVESDINPLYVKKISKKVLEELDPSIRRITSDSIKSFQEISNDKINSIESKTHSLVTEAKKDIEQSRNSIISVIAIFVSLFTFISVNVNIFSKTDFNESIFVAIAMWIMLAGFSCIISIILFTHDDKIIKILSCIVCVIVCIAFSSYLYKHLNPSYYFSIPEDKNSKTENLKANYSIFENNKNSLGLKR
jgi:histone H3/H4